MTAPPASPTLSERQQTAIRAIPFIVGCALFMQMLDATVVATALPQMARSLETTPIQMNITITSYLLALAVFVPISGWASDRFGARRVFLTAIALFSFSSVLCALAQTLMQLVTARTLQGVAGAMMVPVGRVILLRITPKPQLLRAMTFLSMPALIGPIVGPPLGGFLVTYASWHWIFLINVPVGVVGIAAILRYVEVDVPQASNPLDWLGFLLSSVCLATLVYGFESLGESEMSLYAVLGLMGTGLLCGFLYVWHARRTPYPIIDLSLLRIPTFAVAVLGGNLCRFTVGASPFLLALLLQVGFGMSPFMAGLITFSSAVGALLMKFVASPIIKRFGFRQVLAWNAVLSAALVAVCGFFQIHTPIWVMIGTLTIGGISRSLQFTAINTLAYADMDNRQMSQASSFSAMAQQLAISLGVGLAALTLKLSMQWRGGTQLAGIDVQIAFLVAGLMSALAYFSFRRLPKDAAAALR
ncbi:DHA2 family efflux MFS transporter permease subunit [Pusillimonas sp. CC-YST705]|uniref:DHA2 family efflux MFS transporter permease subunit n=1 Tax=Mesopusillimonas faecipullorum TaxID=2755040 RepID=A0ABS8C9I5_9BURK|nr:DHA2 family efflux MFS transporter permease subunit [Mesopusillimonas faecipullorum]MCB5362696.1 DHA2 family efflux MFS transporter permease subunit [Mesopusillimonas faecipullorum]